MPYHYANEYTKEHMARAVGRSLPISWKQSVEICNAVRKRSVARAKTILKDTIAMRKPIKYTRYTHGAGHKFGIGSGKFPQKAAEHILTVIEHAEANAQFKGLNTGGLVIKAISVMNAGNVWRYGRHRRRKMKNSHVEVILEEGKKAEPAKKDTKAAPEAPK